MANIILRKPDRKAGGAKGGSGGPQMRLGGLIENSLIIEGSAKIGQAQNTMLPKVLNLTLLDWADDPWLDPQEATKRLTAGEAYDPMGLKTFMAVATNMRKGGVDSIPSSGKPSWTGDYPWDARFTGQAVVNWIRAGFNLPALGD